MSTRPELVRADQLLYMPDEGVRRKLIKGELRESPFSCLEHGRVAANFGALLHLFVKQNDIGAVFAAGTGFLLASDPDTVLAPDVAFVSRKGMAAVPKDSGYFAGPPDLAVEVISPSDFYLDVEEEIVWWLSAGCRMVVVVKPSNCTLNVYRSRTEILILAMQDSFDGGDVLPGFRLPVRKIFED